ncbi:MAG TPA: D-glycero-beta-D-manno-heptose-7-phosphate kinase [Bacteroidetes bacterium]|nr:D-glycero-beta-D-manno-heptose-7-phosphate kinase [Bacteroidota bacterium]
MIDSAHIKLLKKAPAKLNILVVGDLMLDRYLWGDVSRISPEAPVPIVDVTRQENRPGGAANVALNIAAMGAKVALCGMIGQDDHGELLNSKLQKHGFATSLVMVDPDRPTTSKTRIIGHHQQMLRVDNEVRTPLSSTQQASLLPKIKEQIGEFDAIIFEDYDKGVLSPDFIQEIVNLAARQSIPTIVDPKYRNFLHYSGTTLFKPNLKELNEAFGLRLNKDDLEGIVSVTWKLREQMPHANTLITLSENGILAIGEGMNHTHIPAHYRRIADVSGAGDTVVALMGIALALKIPLPIAAAIANLAGGLVCEEVGVVPINATRLLEEMSK